jgi:hypothetical protein
MAAISKAKINTLRRLLNNAHSHILDAAAAHHKSGDSMAEMRCTALAWQIRGELEYLEKLLPDAPPALPTPVRSLWGAAMMTARRIAGWPFTGIGWVLYGVSWAFLFLASFFFQLGGDIAGESDEL